MVESIKIYGIEDIYDTELITDMVGMALNKGNFMELLNQDKIVYVDCTDCGDSFYGDCVVRLNPRSITFHFRKKAKDGLLS